MDTMQNNFESGNSQFVGLLKTALNLPVSMPLFVFFEQFEAAVDEQIKEPICDEILNVYFDFKEAMLREYTEDTICVGVALYKRLKDFAFSQNNPDFQRHYTPMTGEDWKTIQPFVSAVIRLNWLQSASNPNKREAAESGLNLSQWKALIGVDVKEWTTHFNHADGNNEKKLF